MKKEELEAILGDGEKTPDLGPIEDYLHAVATERSCRISLSECAQ